VAQNGWGAGQPRGLVSWVGKLGFVKHGLGGFSRINNFCENLRVRAAGSACFKGEKGCAAFYYAEK
jgi:hypothetical protein